MFEETNNEKLFILPESLQKSDVNRLARNSEKGTTIVIEDSME